MFWAETGVFHARTSIISVLVEADKHANNFQMFFGIFQESSKTGRGKKKGKKEKQKQKVKTLLHTNNHQPWWWWTRFLPLLGCPKSTCLKIQNPTEPDYGSKTLTFFFKLLDCCCWLRPHLSLLPSGSGSSGISTYRAPLLRTASSWIVLVTVGCVWKWRIPGRPFPAGSSVTVNLRSWETNKQNPPTLATVLRTFFFLVDDFLPHLCFIC